METAPALGRRSRLRKLVRYAAIALTIGVLLAAELGREAYVLEANRPATGTTFSLLGRPSEGWVSASGQWFSTAGSDRLLPNTVRIECRTDLNACVESAATLHKPINSVAIDTTIFTPRQMTDEAIVYENTSPLCVTYLVRIDLQQRRVLATRHRKPGENAMCRGTAERVTMELGDPFEGGNVDRAWEREHFVPLIRLLQSAMG